jgi:hypothetical protein
MTRCDSVRAGCGAYLLTMMSTSVSIVVAGSTGDASDSRAE